MGIDLLFKDIDGLFEDKLVFFNVTINNTIVELHVEQGLYTYKLKRFFIANVTFGSVYGDKLSVDTDMISAEMNKPENQLKI